MTDEEDYAAFVFPGTGEEMSEAQVLIEAAEHMTVMGTMIAQAGLTLGQAMLACPKDSTPQPRENIIDSLRSLTAGADQDDPLPVTICCYLGRAIKGARVLQEQPGVEEVLACIEEWAGQGRSYSDLRYLFSDCVLQTTRDVEQMGAMLKAVRDRLAAAPLD